MIWTAPTGDEYVTDPGGALIFPGLCAPTGPITAVARSTQRCGEKTAKMARRQRIRTQQRAAAIADGRRANTPPPPRSIPEEYVE